MRVLEKRVPTESKGLKIPRTPRPPSPVRRKGAIPGNPQKSLKPSLAKDSSRLRGTVGREQRRRGRGKRECHPLKQSSRKFFQQGSSWRQRIFAPAATLVSSESHNDPRRVSPLMSVIASPFVRIAFTRIHFANGQDPRKRPQRANREVR